MKAEIAAIEYVLPERCVTNDDLDRAHPDWSIHEVAAHTGVLTRYICREDETALDLATMSCQRLFERVDVSKEDIDYVFYVTAHEMAHQWWGHQVTAANVQGSTMLIESLSQYSALMVMEKE